MNLCRVNITIFGNVNSTYEKNVDFKREVRVNFTEHLRIVKVNENLDLSEVSVEPIKDFQNFKPLNLVFKETTTNLNIGMKIQVIGINSGEKVHNL